MFAWKFACLFICEALPRSNATHESYAWRACVAPAISQAKKQDSLLGKPLSGLLRIQRLPQQNSGTEISWYSKMRGEDRSGSCRRHHRRFIGPFGGRPLTACAFLPSGPPRRTISFARQDLLPGTSNIAVFAEPSETDF